ncbi:WGxxGxxG family protein [Paenibacillus agricola]|uniref:WGxxGxxG-CTERM domain-containing protein n=1 Tax=Paenibacillus agricola TaxID=2716264 RepID=A0ABX0JCI0_9BACL|nr:WGxxGxxG family protein [Paenibacillus agricola]NHN34205.1 WGxxGxxG-CTERM domain-containing protein [Paenibacillus agricola]
MNNKLRKLLIGSALMASLVFCNQAFAETGTNGTTGTSTGMGAATNTTSGSYNSYSTIGTNSANYRINANTTTKDMDWGWLGLLGLLGLVGMRGNNRRNTR